VTSNSSDLLRMPTLRPTLCFNGIKITLAFGHAIASKFFRLLTFYTQADPFFLASPGTSAAVSTSTSSNAPPISRIRASRLIQLLLAVPGAPGPTPMFQTRLTLVSVSNLIWILLINSVCMSVLMVTRMFECFTVLLS
jgi:hypothetical protein